MYKMLYLLKYCSRGKPLLMSWSKFNSSERSRSLVEVKVHFTMFPVLTWWKVKNDKKYFNLLLHVVSKKCFQMLAI